MALAFALASLASRIHGGNVQTTPPADCVLFELGGPNDSPTPGSAKRLQYFPESLSDTKTVNWQTKEIPGGSLPLYQYIGSGERTIGFTAVFTSDIDLIVASNAATNLVGGAQSLDEGLTSQALRARNVDIRAAVAWLRQYQLPTYTGTSGQGRAFISPPKKLRLYIPNSGIGLAGGEPASGGNALHDAINCILTQCEVTWEAFFPSGLPRKVSVQLTFAQIAQMGGSVQFPHAGPHMAKAVEGSIGDARNSLGYRLAPRRKTAAGA